MKLLLASKSPRRRQLLSNLNIPIEFVDINVDEHIDSAIAIDKVAEAIALKKAMAYNKAIAEDDILVTADTIVTLDNERLGKPRSRDDARQMLDKLSNRHHVVYTGVCLKSSSDLVSFTEGTEVVFKKLTTDEIDYYIDTYKPYDKAGAYGIQEWIGMIGIEKIIGDYYNVMGLPVAHLYAELMKMR